MKSTIITFLAVALVSQASGLAVANSPNLIHSQIYQLIPQPLQKQNSLYQQSQIQPQAQLNNLQVAEQAAQQAVQVVVQPAAQQALGSLALQISNPIILEIAGQTTQQAASQAAQQTIEIVVSQINQQNVKGTPNSVQQGLQQILVQQKAVLISQNIANQVVQKAIKLIHVAAQEASQKAAQQVVQQVEGIVQNTAQEASQNALKLQNLPINAVLAISQQASVIVSQQALQQVSQQISQQTYQLIQSVAQQIVQQSAQQAASQTANQIVNLAVQIIGKQNIGPFGVYWIQTVLSKNVQKLVQQSVQQAIEHASGQIGQLVSQNLGNQVWQALPYKAILNSQQLNYQQIANGIVELLELQQEVEINSIINQLQAQQQIAQEQQQANSGAQGQQPGVGQVLPGQLSQVQIQKAIQQLQLILQHQQSQPINVLGQQIQPNTPSQLLQNTLQVAIQSQGALNNQIVSNQVLSNSVNSPQEFALQVQQLVGQINKLNIQQLLILAQQQSQSVNLQSQFVQQQIQQVQKQLIIAGQQNGLSQEIQQLQEVLQQLENLQQDLAQEQLAQQLVIQQLQQVLINQNVQLQQLLVSNQLQHEVNQANSGSQNVVGIIV
jgi:hypothetical protein